MSPSRRRIQRLLLAISLTLGCDQEPLHQLRREVDDLRMQVSALEQRADEVDSLKAELDSLRTLQAAAAPAASDAKPITPLTYLPDGSEIDDPYLGPADAPVLLMQFADYQCRPCGQFYNNTFAPLLREYIEKGRVKFVFRDFPLATNPFAQPAAHAAHCAGEQGLYWEMFRFLFEKPDSVRGGAFEQLDAFTTRLDKEKFRSCSKSNRYAEEIAKDAADGARLGVRGAPAFFVGKKTAGNGYDGVLIRGAQPAGVFRAELAKLLKK